VAAAVDAPVRVAFVVSHAGEGGSERYLELLLDFLEPAWVAGVVSLAEGPFVDRLRGAGHGVAVIDTGNRLSIVRSALRLRRLLRRERPAVVHANGVKAALVAGLAARRIGIPVVWVKHDFSWDGPLARLVARHCALVVGVSAAVTATFGARLRDRVRVVHNGVPAIERDRNAARVLVRELAGGDGDVVVLVGRVHRAKGQLELVEAAPRVLARLPDVRFLLLGGDDPHQPRYARDVRARIAELGLEHAFALPGHHPDAPGVMAGCALVAIPSVPDERGMGREGFGLVGVEAMAVGTPVVGYAGGALPEVLSDDAVLVPEGDREALAAAIADLLADPARRAELGARGRAVARERYPIEATIAGMRAVYSEVARGSG
jgi:glycosyltransferase involved in cell wall biosynthesis